MHYYIVFQQLSVKVLKSLISDPLPRMSFFLFLSAFLLSCFVYKFLRRLENRIFGYHFDDEDDAYENSIGSATTTSAGPDMLWANLVPYHSIPDSSIVTPRNNLKSVEVFKNNSVNNSFSFRNHCQHKSTDEDYNLKRKDKLYLAALNRSCPRKSKKIKKVPTVGNLPTIFEFYPYPLPIEVLLSVSEEATPVSSVEIET